MLLWITHTTGIRVTELAQLRIDDVLLPSGAIRAEPYLRAKITKGCRARNIHFTHPKWVQAMQWGCSQETSYRGFFPHSKLVLTHKGQSFELAIKKRLLDTGPKDASCDSLQQTFSRLYRQADIKPELDHTKPYLTVDQSTIRRAFELAL